MSRAASHHTGLGNIKTRQAKPSLSVDVGARIFTGAPIRYFPSVRTEIKCH